MLLFHNEHVTTAMLVSGDDVPRSGLCVEEKTNLFVWSFAEVAQWLQCKQEGNALNYAEL